MLTAQDMALVIEGLELPEEARTKLATDAGERKKFAADLRRMLALAEAGREAGLAARPELRLRLELARSFALARGYFQQRAAGGNRPPPVATAEEIDAVLKTPAQIAQFEAFLEDYREFGPGQGAQFTPEQRAQVREYYGRVIVERDKAVAAGFDRTRAAQLGVLLEQSRLLAGAYTEELRPRFQPTDAEINAYLSAHPELDSRPARAKVEGLLTRARAGEDFAALAKEFSVDRSNKDNGGDLGWFSRGEMVKPFSDVAFALKEGEISNIVETQFGYHIIRLTGRRTQKGEDGAQVEQVRASHILIPYTPTSLRSGKTPMSPRDEARAAVEEEKHDRIIGQILAASRVRVAEIYQVGAAAGQSSAGQTTGAPAAGSPAANKSRAAKPVARPAARPARARRN